MQTKKKHRWQIHKSRVTNRWVAWHTGWANMGDELLAPMKFATWQEAIDYVTRRIELSFDPLIESWT